MDDHPERRRRAQRAECQHRRRSGHHGDAWDGHIGVRPALFVDSDICLSLEQDEVDLSNQALLGEFTSRELVAEVLRRIAAGEKDPDEDE